MTTSVPPPPLDVRPCGRYEWERLVRRISMPRPIMLLALTLSTYADADGSSVRPGQGTLAAVMGVTDRTVRRQTTVLEDDLGLIQMVSRGGGRGGSGTPAVYRLTVPTDLLERVRLLSPGERPEVSPDTWMSGQSLESPDTQMSGQSDESPVDNSVSPDIWMSGENDFHRTSHVGSDRLTGHSASIDRTSGCPTTTHIPTTPSDQPGSHLPAQLTTARAAEAHEPRTDPSELGEARAAPDRCPHGLVTRRRHDGRAACVLCRRDAQPLQRQEPA